MGFVDLHNHLLWGLDDGCETPGDTLAAARLLVALGWSDVAASPHAVAAFPSTDPGFVEARRAEASELLAREGIPLALHSNAENKLDEEFLARAGGTGRRGIGGSQRWVLVEVPFQAGVPALPDLVFRLRRMGVSPLFAHPERCLEFERPGRAEEVVRLGGALQLNMGSLTGLYGKAAKKRAEQLVSERLYAVGASDLHRPDGAQEWLEASLEALEKRAGAGALEELLAVNPRRILAGEELG
ncbi:MAG TPA: CpsB/CapC family capsule biosynthesis tyrosine phosphatase [Anaeromyxobacter sp.]